MESNKSIQFRKVVSLQDGKQLGCIRDVLIDCEHKKVGHVLVGDDQIGSSRLLPWTRVIGTGDAFVTVAEERFLLPIDRDEGKKLFTNPCYLRDIEAFTRVGDRAGTVEGFDFDPATGSLIHITFTDGSRIDPETIIFMSPEHLFIEEREAREIKSVLPQPELRHTAPEDRVKAEPEEAPKAEPAKTTDQEEVVSASDEASEEAAAHQKTLEELNLLNLLKDTILVHDVRSENGKFFAKKDTKITEELLREAQNNDALLLLAMSVDM